MWCKFVRELERALCREGFCWSVTASTSETGLDSGVSCDCSCVPLMFIETVLERREPVPWGGSECVLCERVVSAGLAVEWEGAGPKLYSKDMSRSTSTILLHPRLLRCSLSR